MQVNINLFNFSKINSEHSFKLSDYNYFKYKFGKIESNKRKNKIKFNKNKIISKNYLKRANMTIPSNIRFKDENFRNEFFSNYKDSFANFCGLNEKMFSEIYEKNQLIPEVDQMGDIKVYIDNITKYLNEFSDLKRLKMNRRVRNRIIKRKSKNQCVCNNTALNDFQQIFKIEKNKSNDSSIQENSDFEERKELSNSNSFNSSIEDGTFDKENEQKEKKLLNIKRKIKKLFINKSNVNNHKDLFYLSNTNHINDKTKKEELKELSIQINDNENLFQSEFNNELIFSSIYNKNKDNNFFDFSSTKIPELDKNVSDNNNYDNNEENTESKIFSNEPHLSPHDFCLKKFNLFSQNHSLYTPININNSFNEIFNFNNDIKEEKLYINNIFEEEKSLNDTYSIKGMN